MLTQNVHEELELLIQSDDTWANNVCVPRIVGERESEPGDRLGCNNKRVNDLYSPKLQL